MPRLFPCALQLRDTLPWFLLKNKGIIRALGMGDVRWREVSVFAWIKKWSYNDKQRKKSRASNQNHINHLTQSIGAHLYGTHLKQSFKQTTHVLCFSLVSPWWQQWLAWLTGRSSLKTCSLSVSGPCLTGGRRTALFAVVRGNHQTHQPMSLFLAFPRQKHYVPYFFKSLFMCTLITIITIRSSLFWHTCLAFAHPCSFYRGAQN